jgi:cell division transport system permease protein
MAVVFFLEKDIPEDDIKAIEEQLIQSDLVLKTKYISTEKAREIFQEKFPDLIAIVKNLDINPFPPSFEATLKENRVTSNKVSGFIDMMQNTSGVEDVQYNQDWVERIKSFSRLAKAIGFFLGGILILASFLIISNVIKLNVFSRKDEIEILQLSGGTNMFIRIPFLAEGTILGLIGGVLSLFMLFLLIRLLPIYLGSSLGVFSELISFRYLSFSQCGGVIIGGAVIGFIGSLSSLARFLKPKNIN